MAILIAVLGALGALIWTVVHFVRAAQEGREVVNDVRAGFRRGAWSKKANSRLIEAIEDPRESAAILMAQIAVYDGEITAAQKSKMTALMQEHFAAPADEAEGLYSFGRMAVGQLNDAGNSLTTILRPVQEKLTQAEKNDLVGMLEEIAEVEAAPNDLQRQLIAAVRRGVSEN